MKKNPASYRLSDDARQLIKLLAQRLGVNETAVLELSVRELAEKKGVKLDTLTTEDHIDALKQRLEISQERNRTVE